MSTWTTLEDRTPPRTSKDNSTNTRSSGQNSTPNTRNPTPSRSAPPKTMSSNAAKTSGFASEDFIAFLADEVEESPWVRDNTRNRKRGANEREEQGYRSKKEKQNAESRKTPWASSVDWDTCRTAAEMLNREVKAFVEYISPTEAEHTIRGLVIESIRRAIVTRWADATVTPFGSFETKLYLPLGDIDLVVQSAAMARSDKKYILHTLASVLRQANITSDVRIIAKAKVPIIKFVTSEGRFAVDISLNMTNGISAGQIVNSFCIHMPALRPLVMVVKAFLNQRGMNEVFIGGLGSYSVVCLVISFLQMHPKVRFAEIDPSENLGVLLIEFFQLYGHRFMYDECGISVRAGGFYFNKSLRGWQNVSQPYLLCIEDPQDTANDVSRGSYGIMKVKKTLAGAFEVLSSTMCVRAGQIKPRRSGRHNNFRSSSPEDGPFYDESMSILGSVMGMTDEAVKHRRMINDLYNKGDLHRKLGLPPPSKTRLPSASPPPSSDHGAGPSRAAYEASRPASEGYKSAWEEADDSIQELISYAVDEGSSDEGRYGIEEPAKKRRRFEEDHEVIYISDDDGLPYGEASEDGMIPLAVGGKALRAGLAGRSGSNGSTSKDAKRAYWAGKAGAGLDQLDDSDDY